MAAKLPLNRLTTERDVREKTSSWNVSQQVERSNFAFFDTFTNIFAPRALCVCIPSGANGRAACIMRGI